MYNILSETCVKISTCWFKAFKIGTRLHLCGSTYRLYLAMLQLTGSQHPEIALLYETSVLLTIFRSVTLCIPP
jgi:hypothetical protein